MIVKILYTDGTEETIKNVQSLSSYKQHISLKLEDRTVNLFMYTLKKLVEYEDEDNT